MVTREADGIFTIGVFVIKSDDKDGIVAAMWEREAREEIGVDIRSR